MLEKSGNQEKYLSPQLLDTWLDTLPEGTPVTVVIEACYSGNFISSNGTPTALAGENRTIIVSARGDRQSKIARSSSFSRTFFSYIESNKPVGEAFNQTVRRMEKMQYHRGQHPEMDSNGDGNVNQPEDYALLRERYLSPEPTQTKGADGQTSLGTLELAITNWAKKQVNPQVPLYIYLLSPLALTIMVHLPEL